MADLLYPLYNNTFFTFSVSPLFHQPVPPLPSTSTATSAPAPPPSSLRSSGSDAFLSLRSLSRHAASLRSHLVRSSFPISIPDSASQPLPAPTTTNIAAIANGTSSTAYSAFSASTGRLLSCTWTLIPSERRWLAALEREAERDDGDSGEGEGEDEAGDGGRNRDSVDELAGAEVADPRAARAVLIKLEYERRTHSALLIRNPRGDVATASAASPCSSAAAATSLPPTFSSFPLLLTHMPAPIRSVVVSFLARTFDACVLPLQLPPSVLTRSLETVLRVLDDDGEDSGGGVGGAREQRDRDTDKGRQTTSASSSPPPTPQQARFDTDTEIVPLDQAVKIVQLQFTFPTAGPDLRTVEVSVAKRDIVAFLDYGQHEWQQRCRDSNRGTTVTGTESGSGSGSESGSDPEPQPHPPHSQPGFAQGPFTAALEAYFKTHLSLSLSHPAVQLSRVTCSQFAISVDGKVKFTAPPGGGHVARAKGRARGGGRSGRGRSRRARGGGPSAGGRRSGRSGASGDGSDSGNDDNNNGHGHAPNKTSKNIATRTEMLDTGRSRQARALQGVLDLLLDCAVGR